MYDANREIIVGIQLVMDARLRVLETRFEDVVVVVIAEDVHHAAPVPVVSDTATVVDVSSGVLEHLEGNLVVLLEEHLELADADAQIAVGELVRDVEAEGTELAALENNAVEETKRLQKMLEVSRLQTNPRKTINYRLIN
jgi:hypothetical protein